MPAIDVRDEGAVRLLTLDRPERRNALTPAAYRELTAALAAAAADDAVHVVLLTGAGPGFCSGVDLAELERSADLSDWNVAFRELLDSLLDFPKPIVAAVHGAAIGLGLTILLHCDLVLVADNARLRAPFISVGTTPEAGSSVLLPAAIGSQRAADIVLTGRWVDAAEAVAIGLAARAVPAGALYAEAMATAAQIAGQPLVATVAAKGLLRHGRRDAVRLAIEREYAAASAVTSALGPLRRADRA